MDPIHVQLGPKSVNVSRIFVDGGQSGSRDQDLRRRHIRPGNHSRSAGAQPVQRIDAEHGCLPGIISRGTPFPLLVFKNAKMHYCRILQLQSQHFMRVIPLTPTEASPVLGPRHQFPLGTPAFPLYTCFTKRPLVSAIPLAPSNGLPCF